MVRDNLGRIVEKSEVADGDKDKMKYSYDIAGRLVSAIGPKGFRNYTYDANGNRTFMSSGSHRHGVSYSYDSQDRLIQAGDVKYRYNNNGDLMLKEGDDFEVEYFYDSLGNLKTVNFPRDIYHDPDCNRDFWRKRRHQRKDHRIDYIVDGMGRRVGKKVNGKLVQQFVWQSQLQIAAELDSKGRLVKQFVYGSKVNVPDYMIAGGRTYSIITDQLGSPRLVVDATSGKIAQEVEYDEFGNISKDTEPGFTPFGFAGGLYDRDTKLVRFGARDYDPEVGRWTSKDPILFNGGNNFYGYAQNDPVNMVDPEGEVPALVAVVVGGLLLVMPTAVDTPDEGWNEVISGTITVATGALGANAKALCAAANTGQKFRIGIGIHQNQRVLRIAGEFIQKLEKMGVPGIKNGHFDIIKLGRIQGKK